MKVFLTMCLVLGLLVAGCSPDWCKAIEYAEWALDEAVALAEKIEADIIQFEERLERCANDPNFTTSDPNLIALSIFDCEDLERYVEELRVEYQEVLAEAKMYAAQIGLLLDLAGPVVCDLNDPNIPAMIRP